MARLFIPRRSRRQPSKESGYMMLTLLLMVSLLIIGATVVLPAIKFDITRDREEEMIHRGVQYSRAIRTYYKKFGRYPARMEDLDNTNNLRFLRKHYKDPITGKDFKLLHYGEVKMTLGSPLGGGGINGATSLNGNNAANTSSPFGATPGTPNAGASPVSPLSAPGTDSGDPSQPTDPKQPAAGAAGGQQQPAAAPEDKLAGQTFGGAPIVGVVSVSKKDGIRSFNHKSKYSDWQFIYDPASDRGGLLNSPNQPPPLQSLTTQPGQNGQPGNPTNSPFGPAQGNNPNPAPPAANPNPGNPLLGPPVDQQ